MKRLRLPSLKGWVKKRLKRSGNETGRSGFRAVSPLIINVILVPLFALDLYGEVRSLLRAVDSAQNTTANVGQGEGTATSAKTDQVDFVHLTQWHPFGGLKGPAESLQGKDTKNLPETTLNMQLHGILFIEGTTIPAFALIKVADQKEKVFAIGEVVTGDVRLLGIQGDRVVLDRGGHLETLKLPRGVLKIREPDA
ncbi:MAG: hypothetical protein HQL79_03180 [Magnetococcales bacterium]|nr:hypothetical protein [Magnetococcales bacterium]